MSAQRFIVYRSYDPLALDMVEAQLRAAEIASVRLGRGNAPLLGVGTHIVEQMIEVSAEDAESARELIAAFALPSESDEEEPAEVASETPRRALRSHLFALGMALVYPGLATAYVGLPAAGLVLAAWPLAAIAFTAEFRDAAALALFAHVVPRALELVGSQLWLWRRGRRGPTLPGQLIVAITLLTLFIAGGRRSGPVLSAWVEQWRPPVVKPEP